MCVVKTPKIKSSAEDDKPLPVITNPILDGINPASRSLRVGRQSLRIERKPRAPDMAINPRPAGVRIAGGR